MSSIYTGRSGSKEANIYDSPTFDQDLRIHVNEAVGSATISPSGRDVALASYVSSNSTVDPSISPRSADSKAFISSTWTLHSLLRGIFVIKHHGLPQMYSGPLLLPGTTGSSVLPTRERWFGTLSCRALKPRLSILCMRIPEPLPTSTFPASIPTCLRPVQ